MLSTKINLIIFISLAIINAILIYIYKYRKKKYGIYSTIIFAAIAICYLVYYTIPFKNSIDKKEALHEIERSNEPSSGIQLSDTNLFSDINKEEIIIEKHLNNLDILLRIASIQSIYCIILSLFGLIVVSGRNQYYTLLLIMHSGFFCICCLLEISGHLTE